MNRRWFITTALLGSSVVGKAVAAPLYSTGSGGDEVADTPESRQRLARIVNAAQMGGWTELPIGERMIKIAQYFLGVPYVGGTLEGEPEQCKVDLNGLDCVTFFETTLGIARMLHNGGTTLADLMAEVTFTRYRGGVIDGYPSRLHYTAEWIADNITKGVVIDVTSELNGEPLAINDTFMSTHPQYYKPLTDHPELVPVIANIEKRVNSIPRLFVPKQRIADIEHLLHSGDIVAIATNKAGLDYAHTGLINVVDGEAHFMHASTTQKKVILDATISSYVNGVSSHTGITVVRPV